MKNDKFAKAISMSDRTEARAEAAIMTTPGKLRIDPTVEKHSRKVHTFLRPTEYDKLVARIGRQPLSHVLRKLVTDFLNQPHER
jgi:predicted RNA-binding protein YlqC (UPF0109 family)